VLLTGIAEPITKFCPRNVRDVSPQLAIPGFLDHLLHGEVFCDNRVIVSRIFECKQAVVVLPTLYQTFM
jgi:hypothetical protein